MKEMNVSVAATTRNLFQMNTGKNEKNEAVINQ